MRERSHVEDLIVDGEYCHIILMLSSVILCCFVVGYQYFREIYK
jgi:hypothetical protein